MAKESTQHKLDRVRKPRVHITYDVETLGGMQLKDLPFVVGVMGDFSGNPDVPLAPLKDRKFVEIDRDNFDSVLAGFNARLAYRVDNKLSGNEGEQLNVELRFKSLDDFEPQNVARQVEPLRQLLEVREKLKDLQTKMDGNDKLTAMLDGILQDAEKRDQIAKELPSSPAE